MSWHALQKRVRGLFSRRRQPSPSSSPSGQPRAAATGASELSEKVQHRLHRAAARGDLAWLRRWRWYFKRVGMDLPDRQRRTPLHLASANGHADVIRYLAGKNCKLNLADDLKRTPLMRAVQCQQEECVAILLEHGADPNLADADGNTALHLAVLSGNATVAGLLLEHNASIDAQNQGGYTPLNLAISKQHKEMLECLLKKAAGGNAAEQCERCFRTALAVTTSHEADVEQDKLCLKEEWENVKAQLREVEEKYLNAEKYVQNLMASMDEKDREELAAAEELQDQLLAYFKNHTTVKQLEEHVQRLEIQNTKLEATVHQQSDRIEALLRDLQASASLREVEEKYLNAEKYVQNLMASMDEKDREELAAAEELQDQLLAYFKNHTTVKQLEEHVQRLEIQNTKLEATVHQQSDRIEALLRDLQASASLQEVEKKYLNSERCVQNLIAALDEKERETTALALKLQDQVSEYLETVKQLEEHVQRLGFEKTCLEATVQQQSNRIETLQRDLQASASLQEVEEKYLNSERCVQNLIAALDEKERETTALALKLQDQVSEYLETVKQLEEHVQRLGFEKTCLEATVQQQSNRIETLQRDLQASASAQAASQDRLEHIRASHHASLRNQLKDRIRELECELDKIKNTQDSTFPKECTQAEMEKYKELYLEEVKTRRCLAKKLERANERLEEANAKLLRERHKSKSLITSSIVSGGLAATPVLYSTALGHSGNHLGLNRSLSLGEGFLRQCENVLSSRKRLVTSVVKSLARAQGGTKGLIFDTIPPWLGHMWPHPVSRCGKVRQELDEKITKELKEATAELETGCAGSSKNLHVDQDPLCRAIEEFFF